MEKKPMIIRAPERPKPKPFSLDLGEPDPKVMIYGNSGTGKTYFLSGPLKLGRRVHVISTDFGNGLITLRPLLSPEELKLLTAVNLFDYESVSEYLESLTTADKFWDVLVWEGFSFFNVDLLDEYVLSHVPERGNSLREEGLVATLPDWAGIKRGTHRMLRKFLSLPGAKIVTCVEAAPKSLSESQIAVSLVKSEDVLKRDYGPLIQGSSKILIPPAFDFIVRTVRNGTTYTYEWGGKPELLAKQRIRLFKDVEPADPERTWRTIEASYQTGEGGKV